MVYVDAPIWPYRGMKMCHLLADTLPELHAMAEKLGVRKYFQNMSVHAPHYDICKAKRSLAIKLGAIEIDRKKTVEILNKWKNWQHWKQQL